MDVDDACFLTLESGPWRVRIIFDHALDFNFINSRIFVVSCPNCSLVEQFHHVDAIVPTNIWRNIAILRYAGHRRRQNIFAYLEAEVAAMEVAWWFLARKQSLSGETPAFPFPHSFVHVSADRPSSSSVRNIQHWRERRLRDVDHCHGLAWSSKALRTTERPRQAQAESPPEVVPHEVSVSLGTVGNDGWGTHDKILP